MAVLDLHATDETYRFQSFAVTDTSGNYVLAISSGVWAVDASASGLETRQELAPLPTKLYVAEGQATNVNFHCLKSERAFKRSLER